MQESLDVVQVHQDSHDAVSAAWHGEESIGNLDTLGDTVIHPKICNVVVQKRLDMVACTHWVFHHLVGIKLKIRQSVHDNAAVKEIDNLCFGFQVVRKLVKIRLIGDMEPNPVGAEALLLKYRSERWNELLKKRSIAGIGGRNMPAENFLFHAIHGGHNLGSEERPPLGEQMGHFQMLYTRFFAQGAPTPQMLPIEGVPIPFPVDPDQLYCCPLSSAAGVQRRGEYGGEQHVHPRFLCCEGDE
ncbi:hypothetical protein SDC9_130991 [bioreactor metagenome]|uniref:Uncharacterized protein n=1 Tax=bioreactor metagenome TaxID=1076179 RepID=A0A645D407_9ZZZZ